MKPRPGGEPFREEYAAEKRVWLKISNACNNRCLFCHDAPLQDGTFVPFGECERKVATGAEGGGGRLIVSGGEPSIHPDFLRIVEAGKKAGFRWVQAISNGRMFFYPEFAKRSKESGLDEVTVSIHGPDAETHDRLTGISGSFGQAAGGLKNLLGLGMVVSVDIVINALNVGVLDRIIDAFSSLGVREFDLLFVTPFGRAFEGGGELLLPKSSPAVGRAIMKAIAAGERRGCVIWANRIPPALLEGREGLIQDPRKILDEVRGRREQFDEMIAGKSMRCRDPKRCELCFVSDLCGDLEGDLRALSGGRADELWCAPGEPGDAALAAVRAGGLGAGTVFVEGRKRADLKRGSILADASGAAMANGRYCPHYRLVSEELRLGIPPAEFMAAAMAAGAGPVRGLPPCLGGPKDVVRSIPAGAIALSGGRLSLDLDLWAEDWIFRRYLVKSLRCARCALDGACRGIGLNHARAWGFSQLKPIRGGRAGGGR